MNWERNYIIPRQAAWFIITTCVLSLLLNLECLYIINDVFKTIHAIERENSEQQP